VILGGALAARLSGRPHFRHVREILPGNPDLLSLIPLGLLHRLILKSSTAVLAISGATAAPLTGLDREGKLRVVPNAVAPLPAGSPPADLSSLPGLGPDHWVVAWIGALQPRKAPEDAIRALALAREDIPRLRLLMLGDGWPDYVHGLHRLAVELGVDEEVLFAGYRPDARQLLCGCRALLMTATDEPFGRVVAEAMLDGVPVAAVDGGGVAELVRDGVDGLLSPPDDPVALVRSLLKLYGDPGLAARLAEAAREKAAREWAPERYVREIEAVLDDAAEEG
jgi:glycosyltransferase involved in cell wall biosynthesis